MDVADAGDILLELVKALRTFRTAGQHQGRHTISGTKVGVLQCLTERDARLSDIAGQLSISASVASRAVDALELDGLVQRRSDQTDGRAFVISLTEQGRSDLTQRHLYIAERFADVLEEWTSTDAQDTVRLLQQLNGRLDALTDLLKADERKNPHA